MNQEIQEYIGDRQQELDEYMAKDKQRLLNKLKIGERDYSDGGVSDDYPHWDKFQERAYRISVADVSDEDYLRLLKYNEITNANAWICLFSFLLPVMGLILYFWNRKRLPKPCKQYLKYALIGIAFSVVLGFLDFFLSM